MIKRITTFVPVLLASLLMVGTPSAMAQGGASGQRTHYVHEQSYRTDRYSATYCKCYSVSSANVLGGNATSTVRGSFNSFKQAAEYRNRLTAQGKNVCGGCSKPVSTGSTETCQSIYGLPC